MPNESSRSRSILVVKPSSLGDIVHTLPAVAALRAQHPRAEITWVINPEWAPLLRGNHDINHVHLFPRRGLGGPVRLFRWWRRTRKLQPDIALDFQGLFRSAWISWASSARERWGMSDAREGARLFYNRIAKVNRRAHAVDRYLQLAAGFGAAAASPLHFRLPTGDPLPRFDDHPPFILLHPFARGRRKSLSIPVIKEFCAALAPQRVVVVGRSHRKFTSPDNCVDLTNQTTLLQLILLIRQAQFIISVDSGPMHIAAALTSNLISIHTWSDPLRVGPYNPEAWVWKAGELHRARDWSTRGKLKGHHQFRLEDVAPVVAHVHSIIS